MKKFVASLLAVLMLCLCLTAVAEAVPTFDFTVDAVVDVLISEYDAVQESSDETSVSLKPEEGATIVLEFDKDSRKVTHLYTSVSAALSGSEEAARSSGEAMGYSFGILIYAAQQAEKGEDAVLEAVSETMTTLPQLMTAFTDDDYANMVFGPVAKEVEICGHRAQIEFSLSIADLALVMTASYLP